MCGWLVKLCDPIKHGALYLSALRTQIIIALYKYTLSTLDYIAYASNSTWVNYSEFHICWYHFCLIRLQNMLAHWYVDCKSSSAHHHYNIDEIKHLDSAADSRYILQETDEDTAVWLMLYDIAGIRNQCSNTLSNTIGEGWTECVRHEITQQSLLLERHHCRIYLFIEPIHAYK